MAWVESWLEGILPKAKDLSLPVEVSRNQTTWQWRLLPSVVSSESYLTLYRGPGNALPIPGSVDGMVRLLSWNHVDI